MLSRKYRQKHVKDKRWKARRKKTRIWSRRDGDSVVYMHRNRRNGKIYIGYSTRSCFERWTYSEYKRNGRNNRFYNALIKEKKLYERAGIKTDEQFVGFESRILVDGLSEEQAPEVEEATIAFLKRKGVELYNRTNGGDAPPILRGEDHPMKRPEIAAKSAAARSKPVEAINPKTGERVYLFESTQAAGRDGFNRRDINLCCNNKRKTHAGLIWRFVDEKNNQ